MQGRSTDDPRKAPRRVLWLALTLVTYALLAVGIWIRGRGDDADALLLSLLVGIPVLLLDLFVRVLRPRRKNHDERAWDEVRRREIERRHTRLAVDPLPDRHDPE
jgi:hypothetical protein